jgi:hypothetical protein
MQTKIDYMQTMYSLRHAVFALIAGLTLVSASAQPIQWGLTLTNINNPILPTVVTNGDGSISITAGGGDAYDNPDSITYAYQEVPGDFDIRVRVMNVLLSDPLAAQPESARGSLMVRASLDPGAVDFQINATPLAPAGRDGQIEGIGRMHPGQSTDDLPGRMQQYGGDATVSGYATFPDCWLRIQRQGEKLMGYFATTNTTDFPTGWASNPGSTNGWQLLVVTHAGTNFPKTLYIGLSTVAHNDPISDPDHKVTATYASYGSTPTPPSNPSVNGDPAIAGTGPGAFPNKQVLAANFDASLPADGLGYRPDVVQSNQPAPEQIVWNTGDGFGGVTRDIIANISGQTPGGFSMARYQAGAFDFLLSPRDPVAALQNLGPYSNPSRVRYSSGGTNVPASQAWAPSPNYGFVFTTVHKNGQQWNDTSPAFHAATYVQLDGVASAQGYDMLGGHFRGAQFYTRTTKLVTGSPTDPASNLGNLQRCAIPISVAWFPYDQGWKAGYFEGPDPSNPSVPHWKRGDGWGLNSGTAVIGLPIYSGQSLYNNPTNLLGWVDLADGGGLFTGLATVKLAGVNAVNDGMLFTIGNDEKDSTRGPSASNAALPDGSGWYVAVRDIETSKADPTVYASGSGADASASFSFVYIPYNADNLIGGHIGTNGATLKGAGTFSVARLSTGRYAVTIPGKTGTNGVLLLQNTGYLASQPNGLTNVVDHSFLSYESGGTNTPANAFIIESRYVDASGGGEGVVALRDAEFYFAYVDFMNPLAPPGTSVPVLTITRSGNSAVVSWTNGSGFKLQSTAALEPNAVWTDLGTQNPQTVPLGSNAQFFRAISP